MRPRNVFLTALAALLAIGLGVACAKTGPATTGAYTNPAASDGSKTLANLQTAFNGESNANAKYVEYAKKADAEGYTKVASLFRAAARAEQIHAANHAEVIRQMGGEPKADIKLPEIKSTKENLEDSVKGETYEKDTMYADFLVEARASGNKDAMRTFNFAKTAEGEHAKLYAAAVAGLEDQKGGTVNYFVCPKCGFTTSDPKLEKCPVDYTAKEKFEVVS